MTLLIGARGRGITKMAETNRPSGARWESVVVEIGGARQLPEPDPKREFEEQFRVLAEEWRKETGASSSMTEKLEHPAYKKIIGLGRDAIPLILKELRDRPAYWFEALKALTKLSPVPADGRADPRRVREAWLKWGRENKHL
jgi:hypothetical protein